MAAVLRGDQSQSRIVSKDRIVIDLEWHQRIVFRRNDQCRNTDRRQKMNRRLSGVIVRRRAKPKQRRRESIVELPDRFYFLQPIFAYKDRVRSCSFA